VAVAVPVVVEPALEEVAVVADPAEAEEEEEEESDPDPDPDPVETTLG
jgi:hypothetical protein